MVFGDIRNFVYSVNYLYGDLVVKTSNLINVEVYKIIGVELDEKSNSNIFTLIHFFTGERIRVTQSFINSCFVKVDDALWYYEFFNKENLCWVKTVQRYNKKQVSDLFSYGCNHTPIWNLGFKLPI